MIDWSKIDLGKLGLPKFGGNPRDESEFMSDLRAAVLHKPRVSASLLLLGIVTFVVSGVIWAAFSEIDEATAGQGRVVPSGQVKVVQNLEGGIVLSINVAEGDTVEIGQPLLTIDDIQFRSQYDEERMTLLGMSAAAARLVAEINDAEPEFPDDTAVVQAGIIDRERALMAARKAELDASIEVLTRQVQQKRQELREVNSRIDQLRKSLRLAEQEGEILEPMVEKGVTARIDLVRLQRQINDVASDLKASQESIPRAEAALMEAESKIREQVAKFRSEAQAELNELKVKMAAMTESLAGSEDRVRRTQVVSPSAGIVKKVHINTIGGVIKPGMDLVEIVPRDDRLLVEAKVKPADIAFLTPGQKAKVKLTAYDYSIYGMLDAELVLISADSIEDEKGETFYLIRVETDKSYLGTPDRPLEIIPGMVAEVDVITGKRTVLDYLLKPILRAQGRAFRER